MSEYPKIMTRQGQEVSVCGAAEETERRAEGWCSPLDEPTRVSEKTPQSEPDVEAVAVDDVEAASEPSSDDEPDEPTFGPPGDATHAKRSAKGGKKK